MSKEIDDPLSMYDNAIGEVPAAMGLTAAGLGTTFAIEHHRRKIENPPINNFPHCFSGLIRLIITSCWKS